MGWTNDLLIGIAEHLDAQGVGVRKVGEPYDAGDIAIVIGTTPTDPDQVVVINDYTPDGSNRGGDVTEQVQVLTRGLPDDPGSVRDLRDAVRDALDGLAWVKFGSVAVEQIFHTSGANLGVDDNRREKRSSNYTVQAQRQTALRSD